MTSKRSTTHISGLRFWLAMIATIGVILFGVLIVVLVMMDKEMSALAASLLTTVVMGLLSRSSAAFSFVFDGVPDAVGPTTAAGAPIMKIDDQTPVAVTDTDKSKAAP